MAALYDRLKSPMFTLAAGLLRDRSAAEDAVQESLCRLMRSLRRIQPRCAPQTYLMRIVYNVCIEAMRTRRMSQLQDPQNPAERPLHQASAQPPDVAAMMAERNEALWKVVSRLPDPLRVAVLLRYASGFSNEEAAGILSIQKNAFEVRLHRAMRAMADELTGKPI